MNGTGATVKLGESSYSVDSTKLTNIKNKFISYLGVIQGEDTKVSVGGVEYGIDSSKLENTTSELITTFNSLRGVELIDFTIDGVPYQAEEGMTWEQWVDSEYNVDECFWSYDALGAVLQIPNGYTKNTVSSYLDSDGVWSDPVGKSDFIQAQNYGLCVFMSVPSVDTDW